MITVLHQTNQIRMIHARIRARDCSREDFINGADRLNRLVIEEGLNLLPVIDTAVETPTGAVYHGVTSGAKICGVSIVRSGESMETALRQICPGVRIGKILIQRNEATQLPTLYYKKLPADIERRWVMLMDPMVATGGSALMAIEQLISVGVPEEHIIFVSLIAALEGVRAINERYPKVQMITTAMDDCLNQIKYIIPGIGDFGDRYFGTTD